MTCPKCGAQLSEGATVCPDCGAPVIPVQPAVPAVPKNPDGSLLSKQSYLLKSAPANTKLLTKIALGVALVCLLVVILSANSIINGEFTKIPIIAMVAGESQIDDMEEQLSDILEKVEDAIDDDDDDLIDEFEDEYDMDIEDFRDALDPVSLKSLSKIGDAADEDEEVLLAINLVITFVTVSAILSTALILLGTIFGQTWLVIVNYVFSILYYVLLAGMGYFVVATIVYIVLAVLLSKLNKAYKAYKKSAVA